MKTTFVMVLVLAFAFCLRAWGQVPPTGYPMTEQKDSGELALFLNDVIPHTVYVDYSIRVGLDSSGGEEQTVFTWSPSNAAIAVTPGLFYLDGFLFNQDNLTQGTGLYGSSGVDLAMLQTVGTVYERLAIPYTYYGNLTGWVDYSAYVMPMTGQPGYTVELQANTNLLVATPPAAGSLWLAMTAGFFFMWYILSPLVRRI